MHQRRAARFWHGATFAVGVFALVTQVILAISGASVLVEEDPPNLLERMVRLVGYFTIQANVLVAVTAFTLVRDPARDGRVWRVVRVAAVVGITVTGIVHWFFLRPLLDLTGWSYLCDKLLHVVVPLLAVLGWLLFGPRPRVTPRSRAAGPDLAGRVAGVHPGPRGGDRLVPLPVPQSDVLGGRVGDGRVARDHRLDRGGLVAGLAGRPAAARRTVCRPDDRRRDRPGVAPRLRLVRVGTDALFVVVPAVLGGRRLGLSALHCCPAGLAAGAAVASVPRTAEPARLDPRSDRAAGADRARPAWPG